MGSRLPLVVVLGATGSGKTKLSLELAQKFGGEIIGADSMQVYKGLDIITAKVTKEEQNLAKHHLIDILQPTDTYTVHEYRDKALKIIDDLFKANKVPIVVGGTNYYIESLLWKILVEDPGSHFNHTPWVIATNEHLLPSNELHDKLKLLDPITAKRLHPNNKRKILRALEVLHQKGKPLSDILKDQQTSFGASKSGGALRFSNAIVLWLQCEQAILDQRLKSRVDDMMKIGLIQELSQFHKTYNEERLNQQNEPDYTKGIFQSIGFKEFHTYLMLTEAERKTESGIKKFQEGVELLNIATSRYAKKQIKWVRNRFLGRVDRKAPPVYSLDTTHPEKWQTEISEPAYDIVNSFINNSMSKYQPLTKVSTNSTPNTEDDSFTCDICDRIFVGEFQWQIHRASTRHKKMIERRKKLEMQQAMLQT